MEKLKIFYYEKIADYLNDKNLHLLNAFLERIMVGKSKICYFVEQYQLLSENEQITTKPNLIITKSWYQNYKALMKYSQNYDGSEGGWIDTQEELNHLLTNEYKPNSINIILK